MKAERRFIKAEVRATDGDSPKIIGHGAVFNSRSLDLGGFFEIIAPGAFDECLASGPDIVGFWNHNQDELPLGRTTSGTMQVAVDSVGLRYEIDPADITIARDLLVSIRRKDINASSFGFYCLDEDWSLDPDTDSLIRTVKKADIFDCSPVTFAAYPDADAGLRALMSQAMKNSAEIRAFGKADAELRTRATDMRAKLTKQAATTSDDPEWHIRAHELIEAAERIF